MGKRKRAKHVLRPSQAIPKKQKSENTGPPRGEKRKAKELDAITATLNTMTVVEDEKDNAIMEIVPPGQESDGEEFIGTCTYSKETGTITAVEMLNESRKEMCLVLNLLICGGCTGIKPKQGKHNEEGSVIGILDTTSTTTADIVKDACKCITKPHLSYTDVSNRMRFGGGNKTPRILPLVFSRVLGIIETAIVVTLREIKHISPDSEVLYEHAKRCHGQHADVFICAVRFCLAFQLLTIQSVTSLRNNLITITSLVKNTSSDTEKHKNHKEDIFLSSLLWMAAAATKVSLRHNVDINLEVVIKQSIINECQPQDEFYSNLEAFAIQKKYKPPDVNTTDIDDFLDKVRGSVITNTLPPWEDNYCLNSRSCTVKAGKKMWFISNHDLKRGKFMCNHKKSTFLVITDTGDTRELRMLPPEEESKYSVQEKIGHVTIVVV